MKIINIVGLGPGAIGSLTLDAVEKIEDDRPNFLRTKEHPTIKYFDNKNIDYRSYDYLYEEGENFDKVYSKIVEELIKEAEKYGEINYFVPGNPMVAEKTVVELLALEKDDLDIRLGTGLSFIEPVLELVGHDPVNGFCLLDAIDFSMADININFDCLITQVYNRRVASDLKLVLSEVYGDDYPIYLINKGGVVGEEELIELAIYELDRQESIGNLTSVFIPKVGKEYEIYSLSDIIQTMGRLRSDQGCPWDRKQTALSLRPYIVEEAYELVNAIELDDEDNIIEELGDLLLQVVFLSQIGAEEGYFNIYDVLTKLNKKLIFRHPQVFSNKIVEKNQGLIYNWDRLKDIEHNNQTITESLKKIPSQSSLLKSYKIQEKAAKVGFDWDSVDGPLKKVVEEYEEVLELINEDGDILRIEEEIGDLFFSIVNLSRFLEVDPDIALNRTIKKFIARFDFIEKDTLKKGKKLEDLSLEEMDDLWNQAKKEL